MASPILHFRFKNEDQGIRKALRLDGVVANKVSQHTNMCIANVSKYVHGELLISQILPFKSLNCGTHGRVNLFLTAVWDLAIHFSCGRIITVDVVSARYELSINEIL